MGYLVHSSSCHILSAHDTVRLLRIRPKVDASGGPSQGMGTQGFNPPQIHQCHRARAITGYDGKRPAPQSLRGTRIGKSCYRKKATGAELSAAHSSARVRCPCGQTTGGSAQRAGQDWTVQKPQEVPAGLAGGASMGAAVITRASGDHREPHQPSHTQTSSPFSFAPTSLPVSHLGEPAAAIGMGQGGRKAQDNLCPWSPPAHLQFQHQA